MAYSQNLRNAAERHFQAAEKLNDPELRPARQDVAGYLYGVAGECALKQIMRESGIRPLPPEQRRDDPYYAHFPVLKTMLRDNLYGRRAGDLRAFVEDNSLMNEWDTDMRYAPGKEVTAQRVTLWREHAHKLVNAMEGG
jgi:hypothetical protein